MKQVDALNRRTTYTKSVKVNPEMWKVEFVEGKGIIPKYEMDEDDLRDMQMAREWEREHEVTEAWQPY